MAADYPYQIVGHIGYPSRYAPFGDRRMLYADHAAMFDKILKAIVARGVCLELNTSTKSETEFLPDKSIAERYIELGGREFTFGSDAHDLKRFGEKEDKVKAFLSERGMGFPLLCRREKIYGGRMKFALFFIFALFSYGHVFMCG